VNKKALLLLLLAVAVVWGGNLWYYKSQKLEKPLFLQHYYEIPISLADHLTLYYISNTDSTRTPYKFQLPDGTDLNVENNRIRDRRGRLQSNEVVVSPPKNAFEAITEPMKFEQLDAYYNDGFVDTVPIGEIIIHPNPKAQESPLKMNFSGGSSNGTGSTGYNVEADVSIRAVSSSFPELLSDVMDIEFHGRNLTDIHAFPLSLHAGDHTSLSYQLQFPNDDPRRFHAFHIRISYEDPRGKSVGIHQIIEQPKLYENDLVRYSRMRKGDKSP
jgi:hypothetical protein